MPGELEWQSTRLLIGEVMGSSPWPGTFRSPRPCDARSAPAGRLRSWASLCYDPGRDARRTPARSNPSARRGAVT